MVGQDILDRLRAIYPNASIGQAYASTEAGVVFVVNDGHAGFPMSMIGENAGGIQIRITRDTLQVHSSAMAARYLGQDSKQLVDAEGFVDTGDVIERRGDRYFFVGRRGGVINVGGMKVYPEEVEAVINQHPAVLTSRVWSRPNAITGTVIAADIVPVLSDEGKMHDFSRVRAEIMVSCQAKLAPYKVPVRLTEVTEIPITKSGKIDRRHA
jgi:acyl-CoA synthetase (AMP-forming)/AMP-acid ligase II